MEFGQYMKQVEMLVDGMEKAELVEWVLNYARQVNREERESFINRFRVMDKGVNSQLEKVLAVCEGVNEEKLVLRCEYTGGEWSHYYGEDDEPKYVDDYGIGVALEEGLTIAEQMMGNRQYEEAYELYDTICCLTVTAIDDEAGDEYELVFEQLVHEDVLRVDLKKIACNLLYLLYQIHTGEARMVKLYQSYGWGMARDIGLEDILTSGPEPLPNLDSFMISWIRFLKENNGPRVSDLLKDAVIHHEGMDGMGNLAKECMNRYPEYYIIWLDYLEKMKLDEIIIQDGMLAFEKMNRMFAVRGTIAESVYRATKRQRNDAVAAKAAYVACWASPNIKNILRLYTMEQGAEKCKEIMQKISYLYQTTRGTKRDFRLPEYTTITEQDYYIMKFFNGSIQEVYNKCAQDKTAVGWSYSLKGKMFPLFLLIMAQKEGLSLLQRTVLQEYVREDNFMGLREMEEIVEQFSIWKKKIQLSVEEELRYKQWCRTEIDARVREIVGSQFRNAYSRAARLIVLLDEISEPGDKGDVIKHYRAMFPRHRAFQQELTLLCD